MIKIGKMVRTSLMAGGLALLALANGAIDTTAIAAGKNPNVVGQNAVLRIAASEVGKSRHLDIGPGKAVIVELPRDVRDVLIADPNIMDGVVHTSRRVYLIGKKKGSTTAAFFDAHGKRIYTLDIDIKVSNYQNLQAILKRILPSSNIKVESVGTMVMLTGTVKNPVDSSRASSIVKSYFQSFAENADENKDAKKKKINVVNMLAVAAREQVMLKVRVVEMNREIIKQLGVDLAAATQAGNVAFRMLSSTPFSALGKELFSRGVVNDALIPNGGTLTSNNLAVMLKAMERNGMVRTLSEPNLTAVSGESASFHVGGEVPYPVPQDNNAISVKWKKFGVMLNFTPIVLSEGRISLQVKSEVSELSQEGAINLGGLTLPAFSTRNAESTLELPSGGSMMMAGLISQKTRQAVNGLPGLKNLPVLGTLFRSRDFVREETELVILVTPYIVKPVSSRKLVSPDVGYAAASDAKGNLLGHLNRVYGRRSRLPRGRQHGDYGFIVE